MTAITVELIGDWRKLQNTFRQVDRESQTLGKRLSSTFDNVGQTFQRVGGAMTLGVTAPLLGFAKQAVGAAEEVRALNETTQQIIKTTGGVANVTVKDVNDLTAALERQTGVDGELIQAGSNILLTFKGIRNEQGANNDIFTRANEIMLDLSRVTGQDATGAATMLGKALEDPVRGLTAMRRVGVSFTAQQEEQIKALVESGDQLGAQKLILAELETQYGGTATASRKSTDVIANSWENIQERLGAVLLPMLDRLAGKFEIVAATVEGMSDAQAELAVKIGAVAAAIGPALAAFGTFLRAVSGIGIILSPIGLVLGALGLIAGAFVAAYKSSRPFRESIGDLGDAIKPLWNALQPLITAISKTLVAALVGLTPVATRVAEALVPVVQGVTRFIKQLTSGKGEVSGFASTVGDVFKTVRNVVGAVVDKLVEWFGKGGPVRKFLQENRGFFRETWNAIVGIIKAAAALIREIVAVVAKRVRDIWKEHGDTIKRIVGIAWDAVKEIIRGALKVIRGVIDLVTAAIKGDWRDVWAAVKKILAGVWDAMFGIVRAAVRGIATLVLNWLKGIRDRFVTWFKTIAQNLSVQWFVIRLIFSNAWSAISRIFSNAVSAIRKRIGEWIGGLVSDFRKLPGKIIGAMGDIGKKIKAAFMDVLGKGLNIPIKLLFGGDGLGIGATPDGSGSLLGVSASSAVGRAYSALGRPGDVISGFRPGSRTLSGALSYHARGRALDITPAIGIAHAFRRAFGPRLLELITPWPSLNMWHGRPHRYSDAVQAQHDGRTNVRHIHVAMAEGGYGTVTRPTTFLAGEAGAEDFAFVPHAKGGMARAAVQPVVNVTVHAFLDGKELDVRTEAVIEAREEHNYVRSLMGG